MAQEVILSVLPEFQFIGLPVLLSGRKMRPKVTQKLSSSRGAEK
jgi:hypothetical protein